MSRTEDHLPVSDDDGQWFAVHDPSAAGAVRRTATAMAERAGLDAGQIADLAIVATEVATNLARHAVEGSVLVRMRRGAVSVGIELVAVDHGPGMTDALAFAVDGRSTAGSLGIGLGAIARKSTAFDLYSTPGVGTVLVAGVGGVAVEPEGGVTRPIVGEQVCGDGYGGRWADGRRQIILCDGLGHGPLAGLATQAALAEFQKAPADGPAGVLDYIHHRTRHTRGVVAGVAELDWEVGVVRFAGVGNIVASTVEQAGQRRTMVSMPGILGQQRRDIRQFDYPLADGAIVVLHTDGLTDRWDLRGYPALLDHMPLLIAATLLRDAGKRRDDAAVLVAKRRQ